MIQCKRRMTGDKKINVVFMPSISVQKGDLFAIACEHNNNTKLNTYFFIQDGSTVAHHVTDVTYSKLLNQSEPL